MGETPLQWVWSLFLFYGHSGNSDRHKRMVICQLVHALSVLMGERMSFFYSTKGWLRKVCRQGPYFYRLLHAAEKNLMLNANALEKYQLSHLQKMIHHCYQKIPYYRDLFDQIRLKPDSIQRLQDLERVPFLDKQMVKANFDKLQAKGYPKFLCRTAHTSGTTGFPAYFVRDYHSINMENALVFRFRGQTGDGSKRKLMIRGDLIVPTTQKNPPFWKYNLANQELLMSSYHLSLENSRTYVEKIIEFQPEVLTTFPSVAFLLAKYFRMHHLEYRFDAIFTSSECLEPYMRDFTEEVFQTRIYDWYGQAERVAAISECPHGSYHVVEDYSIVELLESSGGFEVVGTHLHNFAMPLLRYRTSDMVLPADKACSCGLPFRKVKQIMGRYVEPLITPEGNPVMCAPAFVFKGVDCVIEGQFYQERLGEVTIRVLTRDGLNEEERSRLIRNTLHYTSPRMHVQVEEVPHIERGKNGKHISVINKYCSLESGLKDLRSFEPAQQN